VNCTATDSVGNQSICSFTVTVNNPPPVATITGPPSGAVYAVGSPVTFAGTFTDNSGDSHSAQWLFDGTPVAGTVNEASGQVSLTRTFSTPGVYLITLNLTDACGQMPSANTITIGGLPELPAMVVIYEPN